MPNCYLCIHGHFYQPSRINPFNGEIAEEPSAAPYANWNERIAAESYTPIAQAGLFEHISFNLGGTLAYWLDRYAHDTYQRILAAEQAYWQTHGISNGLAQPVHHTILPLARTRDKICQIRWGIASFEHRFGHTTEGMWLPEMAVDYETLDVMVDEGIRFTVLSSEQVHGDRGAGAGPYWVRLPSGRKIAVFVRDVELSNALSFGMPSLTHIEQWIKEQIDWRSRLGGLLLIATDGETFGHHHQQGVKVLKKLLTSARKYDCQITTLAHYLQQHPPQMEIDIVENSAWSCTHHLGRWVVGCDCTPGDSHWKGTLRRALDNLACNLDWVYAQQAQKLGVDPWPLRDEYIAVNLGEMGQREFLNAHGLGHLTEDQAQKILWLLDAQFYRQRMFVSCTFFFESLNRLEPRYAIANGVQAIALTHYASGKDLSRSFHRDLKIVTREGSDITGADILDDILEQAQV